VDVTNKIWLKHKADWNIILPNAIFWLFFISHLKVDLFSKLLNWGHQPDI